MIHIDDPSLTIVSTAPPRMSASAVASAHGSEPYIHAYSGRRIYVRHPDLNPHLHLTDIAHALARIVRFNGHVKHRYSVASHCLMVADLVHPRERAGALMHDAIEAVLGDVCAPLKVLLPDYRAIQDAWEAGMAARWGVALRSPDIKRADMLACAIERCDLGPSEVPWSLEHLEIPPNAPHCSRYADSPGRIARWWYAEAIKLGIPEVA